MVNYTNQENNKVSIFIGSLAGGGAERVACDLANYMTGRGWNINIITMSDKKASYFLKSEIEVYSLLMQEERKGLICNYIIRYIRLKEYMKAHEEDCFIVMLPITIIMMLLLKNNRMKAKVIVAERSIPKRYSKIVKGLLKALAHRADGFVFQTEEAREWYQPYISQIKSQIIPNAVRAEIYSSDRNYKKENRIIAAGRLVPVKNFKMLIKAFSRIAEKYPEYKLYIYGEGPERDNLQRFAEELHVADNIVLPGFINHLREEMEKAKLFVMSSDYEGMPNSLIEAMALGLPCISTDCPGGGPRYLIQNRINGYLVDVGDDEQMAYYMDMLLSSEKLADETGRRAYEITETLKPDKIYPIWEDFIKEVWD